MTKLYMLMREDTQEWLSDYRKYWPGEASIWSKDPQRARLFASVGDAKRSLGYAGRPRGSVVCAYAATIVPGEYQAVAGEPE